MRRWGLAAALLGALVPWLELCRLVRAGAVALLLASCSSPAQARPTFPPGPTIAAHVLAHGQVGLAAAERQDRLEAPADADARWLPVWRAWADLRAAQRGYEEAAARGGCPSDAEVTEALCRLREAMPARWRAATLPDLREVCR